MAYGALPCVLLAMAHPPLALALRDAADTTELTADLKAMLKQYAEFCALALLLVLVLFVMRLLPARPRAERHVSGPSISMLPVEWVWAAFMVVSVSFKLCAATFTVENNVQILTSTIEQAPRKWMCLQASLGGMHALLPNRSLRWKVGVLALRMSIQALASLTLYYRGGQGTGGLKLVQGDAWYLVCPFVGAFAIGELSLIVQRRRNSTLLTELARADLHKEIGEEIGKHRLWERVCPRGGPTRTAAARV